MAAAPFTPLPDSAAAFRATLPKQFRRNLRKSADRFAAEGISRQTIRGLAVLPRLDILRQLHRAQWGTRSRFLPAFDGFVAGCAGGAAVNEVVIHELGSGDLVVATVVAFEVAGRVSLYQSARLTGHRWRDATTALIAAIIDDACARGFAEVDFLRGEESYKGRFTPHHRDMFRLVAGHGVAGQLGSVTSAATFHATQATVRCVRFGRSVTARRKS
jgi:CelD/BcsL family acetyltransferase involved in cellulose biosynthesis